jgi:hypothetical protein
VFTINIKKLVPPNTTHHPKRVTPPGTTQTGSYQILTNRRDTYNLVDTNKQTANKIINQTLHNNKYDFPQTDKQPKPTISPENTAPDTKWVCFTYVGKDTRFITKLFRHISIKIAYETRNMLNKLLLTHTPPPSHSGHLQLTRCLQANMTRL